MTGRVSLRPVEQPDLPLFFEWQRDPRSIRVASFPPRDRPAFDAHWAKCLADPTTTLRTVLLDGVPVGNIGTWMRPPERLVGYWIAREHWGKGVCTAALASFLLEFPDRPLRARVAVDNHASLRVLQKCGFAIVGSDVYALPDGRAGDEHVLELARV